MLVHAIRASIFLGKWPRYGQPDPKDLPSHLQQGPIELVFTVLFTAVVATVAYRGLRRIQRSWVRVTVAIASIPVSAALTFALLYLDPGGVFEWEMD